jgi:hypothetical protein
MKREGRDLFESISALASRDRAKPRETSVAKDTNLALQLTQSRDLDRREGRVGTERNLVKHCDPHWVWSVAWSTMKSFKQASAAETAI